MDWRLFCQIEVIILTVGLVVSFISKSVQNVKDISFFKRIKALGEVLGTMGTKLSDDLANKLSQKKEEKE